MKRVALILLISLATVFNTYAQDSLSVKRELTLIMMIDNLNTKVKNLQHDYNFTFCDSQLHKIQSDFIQLRQDIIIQSNTILGDIAVIGYNEALETSFIKLLAQYCAEFEGLKEKYESVKNLVNTYMDATDFHEAELGVLNAYFDAINKSITTIDLALQKYVKTAKLYSK